MNLENKVLSDIVVHSKYARYLKDFNRRETWEELCWRNADMHIRRYPQLAGDITRVFREYVIPKKVLPSMRSLQFGGKAIERNPARIYNCAYLPIEHTDAFSETMFLLLGGTGVGYSVQHRHVDKLPEVVGPKKRTRRYVIGDSIEGWADAVKVLVESYFYGKRQVVFDYEDIREKGTELVTSGGKAPGPDPLRVCLAQVEAILHGNIGRRLSPINCHDILCFLADAVLAGGIRRAAMISLFSPDDQKMMECKSGDWWERNPQRGRANNSVVLLRGGTTKEEFDRIWERVRASGAGEPGVYWTNNLDWGTNPCCEIALRPYSFCNLSEINGAAVTDKISFLNAAYAGAFLGTLQAGYTDFHYLRPVWKETTEEDALIGVGITGIGFNLIDQDWLDEAANTVVEVNAFYAQEIGINTAARTTTVKPSGTSSLVLGCSSGVHAAHNDYYIRRMRFGKDEAIYKYLNAVIPELCEDEKFRPDSMAVISIPQKAPYGAIVRTESPLSLLERVRAYNELWVREGHVNGDNRNNVSCTISLKDDEWDDVGEWMWKYRSTYNGISVLPYDGGSYVQAPFEDCTAEEYNRLVGLVNDIDLTKVIELENNTDLSGELACAADGCQVI
jgi:ribonucleoside-triphosphate reductase